MLYISIIFAPKVYADTFPGGFPAGTLTYGIGGGLTGASANLASVNDRWVKVVVYQHKNSLFSDSNQKIAAATHELGHALSVAHPSNSSIDAVMQQGLKTKDNYYIVFLSDDNVSKQLSIISANNGRINISNMEENYYPDIIENAVSEFCLEQIIKEVPDVHTY